jgi:predicted DsbA family dithiol-disulfide isomerase
MACPTCLAIRAVLEAAGMEYQDAARIGDSVGKPLEKKIKKRAVSAYNKRYQAAFKKVKGRFKTKAGRWKKNGFRLAVRAAHKIAGK